MPTTYTSSLRLAKPGPGEQTNIWGVTANTDYDLIDTAISGYAEIDMSSDSNVTLTSINGAPDEARNMYLRFSSAVNLTATRDVIVPAASKLYFVVNATNGGQSVRVKTSAGTGITIENGKSRALFCDGTNVINAFNEVAGIEVGINVQAYSALLTSIAALSFGANSYIYGTASNTAAAGTITAFGRSLVDDADATAGRSTLGLGTIATQNSNSISITGGTMSGVTMTSVTISSLSSAITVAQGGTGSTTDSGARTNLDVARLGVVGIVEKTSAHTLEASDRGKVVEINSASNLNVTVPLNSSVAFPVGTTITVMRMGTGTVTIVPTGGVTINSANGETKIDVRYAGVTLVKRATDTWNLFGRLGA